MAKNSDMQNRGTNGTNEYGMKDCHNSGKNAASQNNAKNATSQNNAKNNAKNSSSQNKSSNKASNASGSDCRDSYEK